MKITLPTSFLLITVIAVSVHSFFRYALWIQFWTRVHSCILWLIIGFPEHEVRHTSTTKTARRTKTVLEKVSCDPRCILSPRLSGNRGQHWGQHSGLTTDFMGFISNFPFQSRHCWVALHGKAAWHSHCHTCTDTVTIKNTLQKR